MFIILSEKFYLLVSLVAGLECLIQRIAFSEVKIGIRLVRVMRGYLKLGGTCGFSTHQASWRYILLLLTIFHYLISRRNVALRRRVNKFLKFHAKGLII
jgi:hypothetical protein